MAKAKAEKKETTSDFFHEAIKSLENEDASIVANGILGDVSGWIDTGSYSFNALLSGSIYGGAAGNKVTHLAGEPSTGKTFFALNIVGEFLKANPKGYCFYFEPEVAVHSGMISSRGIDPKRIATVLTPTIEEFRTQAVRVVDKLLERPEKERPPVIMVLDSLGQLSTSKEVADVTSGDPTRDMTRAQLIRGAFRVLTPKLGKAKVPLIMTNHVYTQVMCLGKGTKILLANEDTKNIEDIQKGDLVKTLTGSDKVTELFKMKSSELYELELENGEKIIASSNHKFMTKKGEWTSVENLHIGNEIVATVS